MPDHDIGYTKRTIRDALGRAGMERRRRDLIERLHHILRRLDERTVSGFTGGASHTIWKRQRKNTRDTKISRWSWMGDKSVRSCVLPFQPVCLLTWTSTGSHPLVPCHFPPVLAIRITPVALYARFVLLYFIQHFAALLENGIFVHWRTIKSPRGR